MREMKDSGIEWIGEIPKDWKVVRLKNIKEDIPYAIVDGPFGTAISTSDYVDKGVPLIRIVNIKQPGMTDDNLVYITEEHAEKIARSSLRLNDIVFAKTGATVGKCAINDKFKYAIMSSSCVKISISHNYNNRYFYYFFYTSQFNGEIKNMCSGTTRDTINLKPFSELNCCLPLKKEQKQIADFLDEKCAKIDSIIDKQQKIIERLKEYKLSVITEAVTKGLNLDVEMKDSGVEWISSIPSNWKIMISRFAIENIGDINHYMPETVQDGYSYLMISDLKEKTSDIDFDKCKKVSKEDFIELRKKMQSQKGDVIFARYATIGTVCYVDTDNDFLVSYACVTVRPQKNIICGKYLFYFFKSRVFYEEVKQYINSNTQENVGMEALYKTKITVPPLIEQKNIVDYLDSECNAINNMIKIRKRIIHKFEEYKESLVYEVVTGKKEV